MEPSLEFDEPGSQIESAFHVAGENIGYRNWTWMQPGAVSLIEEVWRCILEPPRFFWLHFCCEIVESFREVNTKSLRYIFIRIWEIEIGRKKKKYYFSLSGITVGNCRMDASQ